MATNTQKAKMAVTAMLVVALLAILLAAAAAATSKPSSSALSRDHASSLSSLEQELQRLPLPLSLFTPSGTLPMLQNAHSASVGKSPHLENPTSAVALVTSSSATSGSSSSSSSRSFAGLPSRPVFMAVSCRPRRSLYLGDHSTFPSISPLPFVLLPTPPFASASRSSLSSGLFLSAGSPQDSFLLASRVLQCYALHLDLGASDPPTDEVGLDEGTSMRGDDRYDIMHTYGVFSDDINADYYYPPPCVRRYPKDPLEESDDPLDPVETLWDPPPPLSRRIASLVSRLCLHPPTLGPSYTSFSSLRPSPSLPLPNASPYDPSANPPQLLPEPDEQTPGAASRSGRMRALALGRVLAASGVIFTPCGSSSLTRPRRPTMHLIVGPSADVYEVAGCAVGRGQSNAERRLLEDVVERSRKRRERRSEEERRGEGKQEKGAASNRFADGGCDDEVEEGLQDLTVEEGISMCADAALDGWRGCETTATTGVGKEGGEPEPEPELVGTLADEEGNVVVLTDEEVRGMLKRR